MPLGFGSGGCHCSEGQWGGGPEPQFVVWRFRVGYSFQREERRCGRHCREKAEGFDAVSDGVDIVQDRFGPDVVGERLFFAWGAGLKREHRLGHVHGVP